VILLDTNVISEVMRSEPDMRVLHWLDTVNELPLFIAMITQAELLTGVACLPEGKRRKSLTAKVEDMLAEDFAGRVLLFDDAASRLYAAIASERRQRGRPISDNDCQIAAIASVHKLSLATRNMRDFEFCGISLIDPWS
jgi:toxin FitB